jgi:glyoxylase-like metal-dependent hydrolase (beta-lactamase superfamily II)
MFLLQYGQEPVPKRISVRGAGDELLWEPIIGVVVETAKGWVLLETGIGRRVLEDGRVLDILYPGVEKPWGHAGDPLTVALAGVGLKVSDLVMAAASHLHCDHSGGVRELAAAGVPITIQREELEFALEKASPTQGYYPPDFAEAAVDWREIDGDAELAPGVRAISTPGHAPGHMSYRVDLPDTGTWLFAVDAGDLAENFTDKVPPGQTVLVNDGVRAEASLHRLLDLKDELKARLVPGHDQLFWDAVRHPKGGHQ